MFDIVQQASFNTGKHNGNIELVRNEVKEKCNYETGSNPTGLKIIPSNWNDYQIKVIFLHLGENEKKATND
jgi:hypothetical protein